MKYVINTQVVKVTHHQPIVRIEKSKGPDDEPITTMEDRGWYIHFEGSYESLYVGDEKPVMQAGDKVKITIEKC